MKIRFSKYHALGNDFIVLQSADIRLAARSRPKLARAICDRHTGVGADGIVWLAASKKADRKFDIFNADGSWAEMSGNGLRIAGLHLYRTRAMKREHRFETASDIKTVTIGPVQTRGVVIKTDLGPPEFLARAIPVKTRRKYFINQPLKLGRVSIPVTCVATGNPHTILIVENFSFDWPALGAEIEVHRAFPKRTNVEFVRIVSDRRIEVRLWERGVGETSSSGTGSAASVAATVMLGMTKRRCTVVSPAGQVEIDWSEKTGGLSLKGPVTYVAEGLFVFGA